VPVVLLLTDQNDQLAIVLLWAFLQRKIKGKLRIGSRLD